MKREYSLATEKLIDRMCRYVEREDFTLNKKKAEECLLKTYDLFDLKRPTKIVWCVDIFDKKFQYSAWSAWSAGSAWSARSARSAWSAGSARSAWSAWSAGSARSARSAWSAGSAWSAWSAGSARSARSAWSAGSAWSAWSAGSAGSAGNYYVDWSALDEDFYYYTFEFEYCKNPDKGHAPNEHDKKYLQYSELLLQALEYGLGYRVEWEDTLYLVPTPLVKLDQENRYHSLEVPAIRWKEGAEFYYSHGVNIKNKDIILHPEKLTKKDWMDEENLEVRRVIQEQMGTEFPKKIGSKLIAKPSKEFKEKHNLFGLYEVELPRDPDKVAHYVRVKDHSTSREYYLRVSPTITDADLALASTFKLNKEEYNPLQES